MAPSNYLLHSRANWSACRKKSPWIKQSLIAEPTVSKPLIQLHIQQIWSQVSSSTSQFLSSVFQEAISVLHLYSRIVFPRYNKPVNSELFMWGITHLTSSCDQFRHNRNLTSQELKSFSATWTAPCNAEWFLENTPRSWNTLHLILKISFHFMVLICMSFSQK